MVLKKSSNNVQDVQTFKNGSAAERLNVVNGFRKVFQAQWRRAVVF